MTRGCPLTWELPRSDSIFIRPARVPSVPADAWNIIRRLPPFVEAVGVFVKLAAAGGGCAGASVAPGYGATARRGIAARSCGIGAHASGDQGDPGEARVSCGIACQVPARRWNFARWIRARAAWRHGPHARLESGAGRAALWPDHPGGRPDAGKYCRGDSRRPAVRRGCCQRRRSAARPKRSRAIARLFAAVEAARD